jgi:hypothetical protein
MILNSYNVQPYFFVPSCFSELYILGFRVFWAVDVFGCGFDKEAY